MTRRCQEWQTNGSSILARCDQMLIGVTRCCWVCFWHSCLMQFSLMRSNMSSLLKWSTNHYVELFHERSSSSQSQLIPVHGGIGVELTYHLYRVFNLLWDLGWFELDSGCVSLPAQFCFGWRNFGRNSWAARWLGGTWQSKSTQSRSQSSWNTLYLT